MFALFTVGIATSCSNEQKTGSGQSKAYNEGYEFGYSFGDDIYTTESVKDFARTQYTAEYGAPRTSEAKQAAERYINEFVRGYQKGRSEQ